MARRGRPAKARAAAAPETDDRLIADPASPAVDGLPPAADAAAASEPAERPKPAVPAGTTPSMAQFIEIKAANPDCLLWYRMGDFYELFFEDAVTASLALGIVLTKRGKHLGEDIPMCGVPVVRADEYLQKLIRLGYRVAVCEQLEDPAEARKRGSKAVVRRDVVRLVTPGTITEDSLLDARAANYLTALFRAPKPAGGEAAMVALASLDISTGAFEVGEAREADLAGELARLSPSEVIAADSIVVDAGLKQLARQTGAALTPVPAASFDHISGERGLKSRLGVADISGYGAFSRAELAAVGALLKYIELTQIGRQPTIRPPRRAGGSATMVIDLATRANLEISKASSGDKQGSLLAAVDRTVTGAGARELALRLASPLRDAAAINERLDAVGLLVEEDRLRADLRASLRAAPDIARALARLGFQRGGPRDLAAVRDGLAAAAECARLLKEGGGVMGLPAELRQIANRLDTSGMGLRASLARALIDEPPPMKRDGGYVRAGFRADLDENRQLRDDSRQVMATFETRYAEATGIRSLKVRHNNQLGYYIEVTATHGPALLKPPHSDAFRHRQTLPNAFRFSTAELAEIEGRISSSAERALAVELEVFNELAGEISRHSRPLGEIAAALAELDHTCGLAEVASEQGYVRPVVSDGSAFEVRGGRHPVVEQALKAHKAAPFIENDCVLGRSEPHRPGMEDREDARIWLVTGPNMAGKSTFLRQNALITLLAQVGSFVPARSAAIGVVDRLFSRVGASDDLARGRSTFMVEMVETAGILNQATERSLVILDEIGRGTATFDGLSIAWATVEYLHGVNRCRALFATHYHELTALRDKLPHIANVTMDVKEWQDEIVFLHKVKPGAADRSYGIQVAKLAGLPREVIARAGEVLALLEKSGAKPSSADLIDDLPLFAAARPKGFAPAVRAAARLPPAPPSPPPEPSKVEAALAVLEPDELTPRAALEALYRLKELARGNGGARRS